MEIELAVLVCAAKKISTHFGLISVIERADHLNLVEEANIKVRRARLWGHGQPMVNVRG